MTALLLREQGFQVFGVTLPTSPLVVEQAQNMAAFLGIEHYVAQDCAVLFQRAVIDYFCAAYRAGLTPNPCIACNRWVKFGGLMDFGLKMGAAWFASGHYAQRVVGINGDIELWRGKDRGKDQSYVLYHLSQERLKKIMLPLGGWYKDQVRREAATRGISLKQGDESQEICFIPADDYRSFLRTRLGDDAFAPGPIRTIEGVEVGRHAGRELYTIGQRRGLGVALGYPVYVVGFVPQDNAVIVGPVAAVCRREIQVKDLCFIAGHAERSFRCTVQVRYRSRPASATVEVDETHKMAIVKMDEALGAVAPGQAAVFYKGERVLGGGVISEAR